MRDMAPLTHSVFIFLLLFSLADITVPICADDVSSDELCTILAFVPFTIRGEEIPIFSRTQHRGNLGFSHMATAILAAKHFNERDDSVVTELSEPQYATDQCHFKFDLDTMRVFDTEIYSQAASTQMQQYIIQSHVNNNKLDNNISNVENAHSNNSTPLPCAVVGAYFDQPARELSILSSTIRIPLVSYRVLDPVMSFNDLHPFLVHTNGLSTSFARPLIDYLKLRGRTNNIAFLVSISSQYQKMAEVFQRVMAADGISTISVNYLVKRFESSPNPTRRLETTSHEEFDDSLEFGYNPISEAFERLKKSGFRTIIILASQIDTVQDLTYMANEADRLGMNTGGHFWMYLSGFPPDANENIWKSELVLKFLRGAAVLDYADGFLIDGDEDAFLKSWRQQDATFLGLVRQLNPIEEGAPGYYNASQDYFQKNIPEPGASFLYDAVMSIGMGACQQNYLEGRVSMPGFSLLEGIKASNFSGASGRVVYGEGVIAGSSGVRKFDSGFYAAYNLFPEGRKGDSFVLTEVLDPYENLVTIPHNSGAGDSWISIEEYIFASGEKVGPPLRDAPDENFMSPSVRKAGFSLLGILLFLTSISMIWIFVYREHRSVRAAQPWMIQILLFGIFCEGCTILTASFDEMSGLNEEQLTRLCIASPWLFIVGHGLIYASLFAKLWRVHKVLQFSRLKITVRQALWPVGVVFLSSVVLLIIWTVIGDFHWQRTVIDEETGVSIGVCEGNPSSSVLLILESFCLFVPVVLSFIWAWKTKDVDKSFSESSWIFALILVQLQTVILGIPLFVILGNLSNNGSHMGFVLMIWIHCMSALVLIMLPKIMSVYKKPKNGGKSTRGTFAGTRVTGIQQVDTAVDSHANVSGGSESPENG